MTQHQTTPNVTQPARVTTPFNAPEYGQEGTADPDRWHPIAGLAFAGLLGILAWQGIFIGVRAVGRAFGWWA